MHCAAFDPDGRGDPTTTCARWDPASVGSMGTASAAGELHYRNVYSDCKASFRLLVPTEDDSGELAQVSDQWQQFEFVDNGSETELVVLVAGAKELLQFRLPVRRDSTDPDSFTVTSGTPVVSIAEQSQSISSFHVAHNLLVPGSVDGSVSLWELSLASSQRRAKRLSHIAKAHKAGVTAVLCLPSGFIVTGGTDQTVKLWKHDGSLVHQFGVQAEAVSCLYRFEDTLGTDERIAAGTSDGTIYVWSLVTRQALAILPEAADSRVLCLTATHTGALLAAGFEDGRVSFHRTNTGSLSAEESEQVESLDFECVGVHTVGGSASAASSDRKRGDTAAASPVVSCAFCFDPEQLMLWQRSGAQTLWPRVPVFDSQRALAESVDRRHRRTGSTASGAAAAASHRRTASTASQRDERKAGDAPLAVAKGEVQFLRFGAPADSAAAAAAAAVGSGRGSATPGSAERKRAYNPADYASPGFPVSDNPDLAALTGLRKPAPAADERDEEPTSAGRVAARGPAGLVSPPAAGGAAGAPAAGSRPAAQPTGAAAGLAWRSPVPSEESSGSREARERLAHDADDDEPIPSAPLAARPHAHPARAAKPAAQPAQAENEDPELPLPLRATPSAAPKRPATASTGRAKPQPKSAAARRPVDEASRPDELPPFEQQQQRPSAGAPLASLSLNASGSAAGDSKRGAPAPGSAAAAPGSSAPAEPPPPTTGAAKGHPVPRPRSALVGGRSRSAKGSASSAKATAATAASVSSSGGSTKKKGGSLKSSTSSTRSAASSEPPAVFVVRDAKPGSAPAAAPKLSAKPALGLAGTSRARTDALIARRSAAALAGAHQASESQGALGKPTINSSKRLLDRLQELKGKKFEDAVSDEQIAELARAEHERTRGTRLDPATRALNLPLAARKYKGLQPLDAEGKDGGADQDLAGGKRAGAARAFVKRQVGKQVSPAYLEQLRHKPDPLDPALWPRSLGIDAHVRRVDSDDYVLALMQQGERSRDRERDRESALAAQSALGAGRQARGDSKRGGDGTGASSAGSAGSAGAAGAKDTSGDGQEWLEDEAARAAAAVATMRPDGPELRLVSELWAADLARWG